MQEKSWRWFPVCYILPMERPTRKITDPNPKTVVIRIRASAQMRDQLWRACADLAIDESEAIRMAIRHWLDYYESHPETIQRAFSQRIHPPKPELARLNSPKKGKIKD